MRFVSPAATNFMLDTLPFSLILIKKRTTLLDAVLRGHAAKNLQFVLDLLKITRHEG
jgi:hypothetical protein